MYGKNHYNIVKLLAFKIKKKKKKPDPHWSDKHKNDVLENWKELSVTKEQSIQEERAGDRVRKVVQLYSTPRALVKSVVEEWWGLWNGLRMYNLIGPLKLLIFCKKRELDTWSKHAKMLWERRGG